MAVTDLDRPAQHAAERACRRGSEHSVGAVEDERLHLAASEVWDDQIGRDDEPGRQFAEVLDACFAGEDAHQWLGSLAVLGCGGGTDGHLHQRRRHPLLHGAGHTVALIGAVQVALDTS